MEKQKQNKTKQKAAVSLLLEWETVFLPLGTPSLASGMYGKKVMCTIFFGTKHSKPKPKTK